MPKGGARARSGPAPDPMSLRQGRAGDDWTKLPAEGRNGPAPEWPLSGQSIREVELWEREWRRPQALMWETGGQELEVALYVRRVAEAETADASVAVGTLVRQMQEALGISVPGLLRNKWAIVGAQERKPAAKTAPVRRASARDRLKVVPDAGVEA
jgi:hypothetical protein